MQLNPKVMDTARQKRPCNIGYLNFTNNFDFSNPSFSLKKFKSRRMNSAVRKAKIAPFVRICRKLWIFLCPMQLLTL